MARTKQTARKCFASKIVRKQLPGQVVARKSAPVTKGGKGIVSGVSAPIVSEE
jgi:hypothetical protein